MGIRIGNGKAGIPTLPRPKRDELDQKEAARAREANKAKVAALVRKTMADQDLRQCDLLDVFNGHSGRASEILNGRRPISKAVALRLSKRLGLPVEELLA